MIPHLKQRLHRLLRWSEKYTKTDMVYFASGNFWLLFGRQIGLASGFILTVAFANLLLPESYGIYKYILAGAGMISAISLTGSSPAAQRALAKEHNNVIRPLVWYSFLWNIPATVVSLGVAAYYFWYGNSILGGGFIFVALSTIFLGLGISKSFFVAVGQFRIAAYFNTLRSVVPTMSILVGLYFTKNVLVLIAICISSQIIMSIVTYYWSLRYIPHKDGDTYLKESKKYSLYLSMMGLIQVPAQYVDQFLLWHFLGPVALASYTIAQGPAKELRIITDNIANIAFPKLAHKEASAHFAANTIPKRTLQLLLPFACIILLYVLFAPILFKIFFPKYLGSVFYSQLIAFGLLLQPRTLADTFLFAHSGVKDRFAINIPDSIIRIILFAILIPLFGILGAIAATYITEICTTGIVYYRYRAFEQKIALLNK